MKHTITRYDRKIRAGFADDIEARGRLRKLCLDSEYDFHFLECQHGQRLTHLVVRPDPSRVEENLIYDMLVSGRVTYGVPVIAVIDQKFKPRKTA